MASSETRPDVGPEVAFAGLTFAPVPEGTKPKAVFVLVKLDGDAGAGQDEWCVRTAGAYNRLEFFGALSAYVEALKRDEALGWFEDEDDDPK